MPLVNSIDGVLSLTLDLIYPRRCPICDDLVMPGHLAHRKCEKKIKYVRGNCCIKCGKKLIGTESVEFCQDCSNVRHRFKRNFPLFQYRSISGSVYRFKYLGRQEYADFYAEAAVRKLGEKLRRLNIDAIIPVPMYRDKQYKRGYNQAEVFACRLSERLGIPMYKDVIVRSRDTLPMKQLDVRGRRNNLKKAFNIVRNDVEFKCILIIDDIYTTGSTIDEIAHEFQMEGVREVYSMTLSIGQTT